MKRTVRKKVRSKADVKKLLEDISKKMTPEEAKALKLAITSRSKFRERHVESVLKLWHDYCCTRILLIADKLRVYDGSITELCRSPATLTPLADRCWGFKLGDYVKVKGTFEEFKSMQKATLGWNGSLRSIYEESGIIMSRRSEYESAVNLLFPRVQTQCTLYAGVLEKAIEPGRGCQKSEKILSTWHVGDIVTVNSSFLMAMMMRSDSFSAAEKAEILGFSGKKAIVTVDGQQALMMKTALLLPSPDKTPIEKKITLSSEGFKVGENVTMIKSIKKLIENQKNKGGWSKEMSKLREKEVRVLSIEDDGSLIVQIPNGRSWRVNAASVSKPGGREPDEEDDLPFATGDVVKVKITANVSSILGRNGISPTFSKYMCLVGIVSAIENEHQLCVRFSNEKHLAYHVQFHRNLLQPATDKEKENFLAAQEKIDHLAAGSQVHLDVGPPSFVKEVLQGAGKGEAVISALTKSLKLKGFLPNDKAVVEYDDGSMYTIKKKYLTVPERFDLEKREKRLDLDTSHQILTLIREAILLKDDVKASCRSEPIEFVHMSSGNPPSIHIGVNPGIAADPKEVAKYLTQTLKQKVEDNCEGQFLIRDDVGEVKVRITLSREELGAGETTAEEAASAVRAEQFVVPPKPSTKELEEAPTHYLRLYNRQLGRDLYFPYVVYGTERQQDKPEQKAEAQSGKPSNVFSMADCNVSIINKN